MRKKPALTGLMRDLAGKDLDLVKDLARKDVDFVKGLAKRDFVKDLAKVDLLRTHRAKEHKRRTRLLIALALLSGFVVLGAVAFVLLRGRCPFLKSGRWTHRLDSDLPSSTLTLDEVEEPGDWLEASEQPGKRRAASLLDVKGVDPADARKLEAIGLKTTDDLLSAGASPEGRKELTAATGIEGIVILRWVNMADLCRVKGVGEGYSDLLEAAGVDTVPELAQRRADNLTLRMAEVNEERQFVRRLPTESQVAGWIENAKSLPRLVTY